MRHKFALGNRVRDVVSGMEGITTHRLEFLNGCIQYAITPGVDKDGKYQSGQYFDQEQLDLVDEGIAPRMIALLAETGGPSDPDAVLRSIRTGGPTPGERLPTERR